MTGLERSLLRFLGVWTVWAGVELLERVAYRAGVADTADDLEAVDCSDVLPLCPDPTRHEHATAGAAA